MGNVFITYQSIMKEATKYKKDDINKAISIIRKAIEIFPDCAKFEGYFRLIKFLAIAKQHDEVQKEYDTLLKDINLKINSEPFSSASFIYLSMSDYFAKENIILKALYYSVLSYWYAVIRTAFAGQGKHLDYLLSDKYVYPSIQKSIIKLKNVDEKYVFQSISNILKEYSKELKIIANLNYKIGCSNIFLKLPYNENESYDFRLSRIANENNEYSQCMKIIKEINFESEYDIKIKPLL